MEDKRNTTAYSIVLHRGHPMQSRPPDLRRADSSATPQRRRHRQPTSVVPRVVRGSPVICRRVRRKRHHLAAARSPHRRFAGSSPNGDDRRHQNPSPQAFPTSAGHSRGLCARSPDLRTARVTTASLLRSRTYMHLIRVVRTQFWVPGARVGILQYFRRFPVNTKLVPSIPNFPGRH